MRNPLKFIFVILSFFQFLFSIEYNWSYIRSELNPIDLIALDEKIVASYNSFIVEYDYDGNILEKIDLKERYNFNNIVNIEADSFNNTWIISTDGDIFVLDSDYNLKKTFNYLGIDKIESCINYQNSGDVYSLCSYVDGSNLGVLSFIYNSNGVPEYMDYYLSENANYIDMEIVDEIIYLATNLGIYIADINLNLKLPSSWNLSFTEETVIGLEQYNDMIIILTAENDNINILDENSNILPGGSIQEYYTSFVDSKVRGNNFSLLLNNNMLYYEIEPSLSFNLSGSRELDNSSYNLLSVNSNHILASITNQGFVIIDSILNENHVISNTSSMGGYNAVVSLENGSVAAIGTKLNEDQSVDYAGILHYDNGSFINYVPSYFQNKYKVDLEDDFNLTALNYHPGEKYCQSVIELEDNHIAFSNSGMRHNGDSKGGLIIIDLDLRKIDDIFNTENTDEILGGQNGIYKDDWNDNYTLINQILSFENKIYVLNPYNEFYHKPLCIYDMSTASWSGVNIGNDNLYLPQGLAIDRNGQIWIGFMNEVTYEPYGDPYSDGGIRLINENNQFTEIDNDEILIGGEGSDVWSVDICKYDNFDILWVLSSEGVQGYTIFQNQLSPISNMDLFSEIPFYKGDHLKCDQSSNVWITTTHSGVRTILSENNYTDFWPSYDGMRSDNSGLLSDIVYDIDFNSKSGKIYFATNRGISILHSPFSDVSYNNKNEYEIYFDKNPFVVPRDENLVISNIPLGSTITIMDLNGNVLRRIKGSNFTQYIWDGKDRGGNYLNSGVYIVASSNSNNQNSISKVAIIRDK